MKTCVIQVNIDNNSPLIKFCTNQVKLWAENSGFDYKLITQLQSWASKFTFYKQYQQSHQRFHSLLSLADEYDTLIYLDTDILPVLHPVFPDINFGITQYRKSPLQVKFPTFYNIGVMSISNKEAIREIFDFYSLYHNTSLPKSHDSPHIDEYIFNCWAKGTSHSLFSLDKHVFNCKVRGRNGSAQHPLPNSFVHFSGKYKEMDYNDFIHWIKIIDNYYGKSNFDHFPDSFSEVIRDPGVNKFYL